MTDQTQHAEDNIDYTKHFNAAVEWVRPHAETQEDLIRAINDRTYDEVSTQTRTLESNLYKFEIDVEYLETDAADIADVFDMAGYTTTYVRDERYRGNVDPDRLLVVLTPHAQPVDS